MLISIYRFYSLNLSTFRSTPTLTRRSSARCTEQQEALYGHYLATRDEPYSQPVKAVADLEAEPSDGQSVLAGSLLKRSRGDSRGLWRNGGSKLPHRFRKSKHLPLRPPFLRLMHDFSRAMFRLSMSFRDAIRDAFCLPHCLFSQVEKNSENLSETAASDFALYFRYSR